MEETASAKWLIEEVKNRFQFSILTLWLRILTERKHPPRGAFFWWTPFYFFCCFDGYLSYPPSETEWHRFFRNTGKQTSGGVQPFCSRGQYPQWDVASILWGHTACMCRNSCLTLLSRSWTEIFSNYVTVRSSPYSRKLKLRYRSRYKRNIYWPTFLICLNIRSCLSFTSLWL
jgi:hypothetical protein